jgi:hypothetical protein
LKSSDVLRALRQRHGKGEGAAEWAFFEELRVGTGYQTIETRATGTNPEQRLDAWAINLYPSKNFLKVAYEVKVSRADFLNEIKNPAKRQQGLQFSNEFYFAPPAGLVKQEEIPPECGLICIKEDGSSRLILQAPRRKTDEQATWRFFASIARRASMAERKLIDLK